MEPTQSLMVGKVRWFDATQQCGVLAAVTGAGYFFEGADGDDAAAHVTPGQLVTFSRARAGQPTRMASDVHPLRPRIIDERPQIRAEEPQPDRRSHRFARPWRTSAPALHGV